MERPVELLPTEDLSPVLSGLVPCNPVALDIGGSLVKIVFWERENGPKLPDWVRPDTGPEHLPLRPLSRPSSPAPLTRTPSAGTLAWSPCVSPAASPAPDGTVTPTGTRRARFCDAHGFSVECLSHTRTSLFLFLSLSLYRSRFRCGGCGGTVTAPNFRGVLRFIKFPESYIPKFVRWLKKNGLVEIYLEDTRTVHATGGGAFRYADLAMRELGTQIISHVCPQPTHTHTSTQESHGHCCHCCNRTSSGARCADSPSCSTTPSARSSPTRTSTSASAPHPAFATLTLVHTQKTPCATITTAWGMETQWAAKSGFFPYMLVTVGSGVSVMKVNSPTDFERVGGTALGGGSFWGLCKLLTNIGDFDELMEIIKGGDPTKTDLLVGDIYGGNYDAIGLNATTTASLFAPPIPKQEFLTLLL